jgi:hypothetical protein
VVTDRDTFHLVQIEGLSITPLPVFHGGEYICMGFEFSPASYPDSRLPQDRFVYLSDVSKIPEEIMRWITRGGEESRPRVLVVDALKRTPHFSHFGLDEVI